MAPRRWLLASAAAALLLLCCSAASARTPSWESPLRLNTKSAFNVKTLEWLQRRGRDITDEPAYFAVKYEVPPALHDEFIDMWEKWARSMDDARGNDFYQLSKINTNNLEFWSYSEWDTFGDLMEHCTSKDATEFYDFLDDNDIMMHAFPLEAVGDRKREYRADREGPAAAAAARAAAEKDLERRRRRTEGESWDPRDNAAHVAIQFHVPPSMRGDFVDAFSDIQDRVVKDEDENRFYVLRKFATLNHHYVLRGGWDSLESYFDHITSKHFRHLKDFTADNDIEWYAEPFRVLYSSEEMDEEMKARKA